jgi:hypothetical protein
MHAVYESAGQSDPGDGSRWRPSLRALLIALVLGAVAGSISALFLTVVEAKGLVISLPS